MRSLTIRGGTLAVPAGGQAASVALVQGDLQIVDGEITAVGLVTDDRGELIDATGLLVMPGVIDPQVHFREPGATQKEDIRTGSIACAAGGVTAFLEMPNTNPPTTTAAALQAKLDTAAASSVVDFGFFIGATPDNLDVLCSVHDTPAIKIFMGSSTGTLLVNEPQDLDRIFAVGHLPIAVHAEDEARLIARKKLFADRTDVAAHTELRDATAALLATQLAYSLSEKHNRRLHVLHLSTGDEVEFLRARGKGAGRVTCEVTPQHLLLNAPEIYERLGTKAQMNPPLRTVEHSEILWSGLLDGTIDCIATDHAPHTLQEKAAGYGKAPSGMPGVETSLAAMLNAASDGRCTVEQVVQWMTAGPADCYRIAKKGRLAPGFDGDVTLVDLKETRCVDDRPIRSRCGWSPFAGVPLTGWPVTTIVRGAPVYRDGALIEGVAGQALRFRC